MIDCILIPLDGSELSDRILLDVRRLLLSLGDVEVHLLEVVEPLAHAPADWVDEPDSTPSPIQLCLRGARRHLNRVRRDVEGEGVKVQTRVLMGDPGREILRAIDRLKPDLVAMATHGRSGLPRWIRGSVAERVLRRSPAPLFLSNAYRAPGRAWGTTFRRMLLPLDGSEMALRILPLAQAFAEQYDAEILLLRVVGLPIPYAADAGYMLPPPGLLTAEEGAETLRPLQQHLEACGQSARVLGTTGEAASEILRVLEDEDVDVLAMTTHGRTGLDRWLFGSVAEKVLRKCPTPLLLLRVAGELETRNDPFGSPALQAQGRQR